MIVGLEIVVLLGIVAGTTCSLNYWACKFMTLFILVPFYVIPAGILDLILLIVGYNGEKKKWDINSIFSIIFIIILGTIVTLVVLGYIDGKRNEKEAEYYRLQSQNYRGNF